MFLEEARRAQTRRKMDLHEAMAVVMGGGKDAARQKRKVIDGWKGDMKTVDEKAIGTRKQTEKERSGVRANWSRLRGFLGGRRPGKGGA